MYGPLAQIDPIKQRCKLKSTLDTLGILVHFSHFRISGMLCQRINPFLELFERGVVSPDGLFQILDSWRSLTYKYLKTT